MFTSRPCSHHPLRTSFLGRLRGLSYGTGHVCSWGWRPRNANPPPLLRKVPCLPVQSENNKELSVAAASGVQCTHQNMSKSHSLLLPPTHLSMRDSPVLTRFFFFFFFFLFDPLFNPWKTRTIADDNVIFARLKPEIEDFGRSKGRTRWTWQRSRRVWSRWVLWREKKWIPLVLHHSMWPRNYGEKVQSWEEAYRKCRSKM